MGFRDTNERTDCNHAWLDAFAPWLTAVALAAILISTLYPFTFSAPATALRRMGPAIGWFHPVAKSPFGWFLNVVLFVPFGAGVSWWERRKGWSPAGRWTSVIVCGLLLSFLVESFQLYLPMRDASWDDVFMNTLGSAAGHWMLERWGEAALHFVETALADLNSILSG